MVRLVEIILLMFENPIITIIGFVLLFFIMRTIVLNSKKEQVENLNDEVVIKKNVSWKIALMILIPIILITNFIVYVISGLSCGLGGSNYPDTCFLSALLKYFVPFFIASLIILTGVPYTLWSLYNDSKSRFGYIFISILTVVVLVSFFYFFYIINIL